MNGDLSASVICHGVKKMKTRLLTGLGALALLGASAAYANAAPAASGLKAGFNINLDRLVKTIALRPPGIRRSLRQRGYYNIYFTDRVLPVYKARACKNGRQFALRLDRWGRVMRRTRLGSCGIVGPRRGLSLPEIRRSLRQRGFHNIRYTDRQLPVYKARVCKNGRRFALRLNRWGKIMRRQSIGWCNNVGPRRGLSLPEIRRSLRQRGFYNIRYTDRQLPVYEARVCKNGDRFYLLLNRFGRIMDREPIGSCRN